MKFGVLGFGYHGFAGLERQFKERGHYTVNLGDNAQTIAARHVYRSLGVDAEDIVMIDRDRLQEYDGPPACLIMNGVFWDRHLPAPPAITPIFIGFSARDAGLVRRHRDWLRSHQPIGCRDLSTAAMLAAEGIEAFVSGCITMCLPKREAAPADGRLFIVFGAGAGTLPMQVLSAVPAPLLERAELVNHRLPVFRFPLPAEGIESAESCENELLRRYRDEASLVLTPLLHVASPCLGMGIPVVLCRRDREGRFGFLDTIMPLYTPDQIDRIDWDPPVLDVSSHVGRITEFVRQRIRA